MSEIDEETIAGIVRSAMLSDPRDGTFRERLEDRTLISTEAARQILALVLPAIERARVEERERAAVLAERYAEVALKCDRCGDVRNTYVPGGCTGEAQYRKSEEFKRSEVLGSAYDAMRFFEKHLCNPREMTQEETVAAIVAAIRKT